MKREHQEYESGNRPQGTDDEISNPKGPYHTLVDIGVAQKTETLYEQCSLQVIGVFVKSILKSVVGARTWSLNFGANKLMCEFVTTSDEAFALLLLENNAAKWLEEVEDPDLPKRERKRAIYTQAETKGPSWTNEGVDKYVRVQDKRERVRMLARSDPDGPTGKRFYSIERYVRAKLGSDNNRLVARNKRKLEEMRRKMDGEDDPQRKMDEMRNKALLRAMQSTRTMTPHIIEPIVDVNDDFNNMNNVTNMESI